MIEQIEPIVKSGIDHKLGLTRCYVDQIWQRV